MIFTAVLVNAREGGFTAFNPGTGTASQGETAEEALANLREAPRSSTSRSFRC